MAAAMGDLPGSKNVKVGFAGGRYLICAVDLAKTFGLSASGKSKTVAGSGGNKPIGKTNVSLGLNAYVKDGKQFEKSGLAKFDPKAELGKNIVWSLDGTVLSMKVDLQQEGTLASSGKTKLIATSSGNRQIGTSSVMVGLNIYHKVGVEVDLGALPSSGTELAADFAAGPWTAHGFEVRLEDGGKKAKMTVPLPGTLRESKSGKTKNLACTDAGNLMLGSTGISLNLNMYTKDPKVTLTGPKSAAAADWQELKYVKKERKSGGRKSGGQEEKEGAAGSEDRDEDVPSKAQGMRIRCGKDKLLLEIDLTGDLGESSSGVTRIIASTGGSAEIKDTNLVVSASAYKKIPGAKRKEVPKPQKEEKAKDPKTQPDAKKRKVAKASKWTEDQVLDAVRAYMNNLTDDQQITLGTMRADICAKQGWEETPELKQQVKASFRQVQAEQDEEDEE